MATDDMRVRLHLREIRVLEVLVDTPSVLRVKVESTVRRLRCVACGFRCERVHERREREIRDLEISGRATVLVWLQRRFDCEHCEHRSSEQHCEFDDKLTLRLARRLASDARVMTIRAVVRRHGVGWHTVNAVVLGWSQLIVEHRRAQRCRVLLVDETSMRKRHRYVTVIVCLWVSTPPKISARSAVMMVMPPRYRFDVWHHRPGRRTGHSRCSAQGSYQVTSVQPVGARPAIPRRLTLLRTTTARLKHSTGSVTSTRPANCPSSTTSSTPSSPGPTRSWPGTTQTGPPTAGSKKLTTSYKSYEEPPTASPTPPTSPPAPSC